MTQPATQSSPARFTQLFLGLLLIFFLLGCQNRANDDLVDLPAITPSIDQMAAASSSAQQPLETNNVVEALNDGSAAAVDSPPAAMSLTATLLGEEEITNFPANGRLVVAFNQPMDIDGPVEPLKIDPPLQGAFTWDESEQLVQFEPQRNWSRNETYTVRVNPYLTTADGHEAGELAAWTMKIAEPVRILVLTPSNREVTTREVEFYLTLNRPIDAASLTEAFSLNPSLPFEVEELIDPAHFRITLLEPLAWNQRYQVQIGGAIQTRGGVPLNLERNWLVELAPLVSELLPPTADAPRRPLQLNLNYDLTLSQISETFAIEPPLAGEWSLSNSGHAVFTPEDSWSGRIPYELQMVQPLRLADGLEFEPFEPLPFGNLPVIVSARPEGTNVSPQSLITITFDRPMDQTATAAALRFEPPLNGTVRWDGEASLIFEPEERFLGHYSSYQVTLSQAVAADGEALLDEPYTWTFATQNHDRAAFFGWGANYQQLDVNGRRAVQLTSYETMGERLTFDLRPLTSSQMIDRYSSGFVGVNGYEEVLISNAGIEPLLTWETEITNSAVQYENVIETIIPDEVPAGLYILNMRYDGQLQAQLLVSLSDQVVTVKEGQEQLTVWVSDLQGAVRPQVPVVVVDRSGQEIAAGLTNDDGVFTAELADTNLTPLLVLAGEPGNQTLTGLTYEWRSDFSYWPWWLDQQGATHSVAHVYTNRPIYRPGETVYFKAALRLDDDAVLSLVPAGTEVTVRLRDARHNVVKTDTAVTNGFGTLNGEFVLGEGAMTGEYQIEIELDGERSSGQFRVEDYRRPEYSVTVTADRDVYVMGDTAQITAEAAYYFGEPVVGASALLTRLNSFAYDYYGGWAPPTDEERWLPDASSDNATAETDENGRVEMSSRLEIEPYQNNSYSQYNDPIKFMEKVFEVTIEDGSGQSITGRTRVKLFYMKEGVTMDTNGYLHEPQTPFPVRLQVEDYRGQPVRDRTVNLTLYRWSTVQGDYLDLRQTWQGVSDAQGSVVINTAIAEEGSYRLVASGTGEDGQLFSMERWIYVYSGSSNWFGGGETGIEIQPNRLSYAPGETARLLVQTPISGPAWLTVERGTVRRSVPVVLQSPVTMVELPIEETDAPNIFVALNVWEPQETVITPNTYQSLPEAQLLTEKVELKVPATNKVLSVEVTADRESYAPGEQATATVRVVNTKGEPVSAELSLAVVDEALFALASDDNGTLYDSFYFDRLHEIATYNALRPVRYLGGGGGGGGDGGVEGLPLRADFTEAVVWEPVLMTDANGEATITFTVPDGLTTWRMTAKALTADTQVGEGIGQFIVRRDVVVRPFLPEGLIAGDQMVLSTMVQNFTEERLTLEVALRTTDVAQVALTDGESQTITLSPGESSVVGWQLTALTAGQAELTIEALRDGVRQDGVVVPLTIRPLAVLDQQSDTGSFENELTLEFDWSADALPQSTLQIDLSRSIAGTMLEGLDYLTGFPYGCVEQTMSRALPNAVVGRAFNQLGVAAPTLTADLPAKIDVGLQRLYGFQHPDGGWGWWYDDRTDPYQTAWVLFGLINTREAGYEVDPAVIENGVLWLANHLDEIDPRTRAYALYVMVLSEAEVEIRIPEAENIALVDLIQRETRQLIQDELATDTFSQAAVVLTLWHMGLTDDAQQQLERLAAAASQTADGEVYWPNAEDDGGYRRKTMASTLRSTAFALSAFSQIDPEHALIPGMVDYLMAERGYRGWGTTNETAFAIIGLTDYLLATSFGDEAPTTTVEVVLNGEVVQSLVMGPGRPTASIEIPATELLLGRNTLVLQQDGEQPLLYAVNRQQFVAQTTIEAAGTLQIERVYRDEDGQIIDPEGLAVNQLVTVELRVETTEPLSFVLIEDKLPGGFEALNEGLNITRYVPARPWTEHEFRYEQLGYNHKEILDGRVTFFITELSHGTKVIRYVARVTHSGTFVAMPAEIYPMYDLATWGRSASAVVIVETE